MTIRRKLMLPPVCLALLAGLAACVASQPQAPYPAFIQVDDLPDVFIAGLPGVRAQQLAGNPNTRRSSYRIMLPPDWQFTTGASPGKSVEVFVLAGAIGLADLTLGVGGYAYIPSGSTGMQMTSLNGALILYFLDDANAEAVIQTPLILDSNLVGWSLLSESPNDIGLSVKELRADPGSGARTWLMKIDPVATRSWHRSSTTREGYLVSGSYRDGVCIDGQAVTGDYTPGGYFHRVPGALYGGSGATSVDGAIWFFRVQERETLQTLAEGDCATPAG